MAPAMKIVFGLLTFVTVGMIIGNIHHILNSDSESWSYVLFTFAYSFEDNETKILSGYWIELGS